MVPPKRSVKKSIISPIVDPPTIATALPDLPATADRVNNIIHKETAMYKAGVTRNKVYGVINDLLSAEDVSRSYDKELGWVETRVANVEKRAKGAELALKAFGDLKEMNRIEGNVTHNTVIYKWGDVRVAAVDVGGR